MVSREGEEPFLRLKESHKEYTVFDGRYERSGKADEIFVDEEDRPLHMLVPIEAVRINDKRQVVEVADSKEKVEQAPSFADSDELDPELLRAGATPPPQPRGRLGKPPTRRRIRPRRAGGRSSGRKRPGSGHIGDAPNPDRLVGRHERVADHETRDPDAADQPRGDEQTPSEAPASEQASQREMRRIRRRA